MTIIIVPEDLVKKCKRRAKEIDAHYTKLGLTNQIHSKGKVSRSMRVNLFTFGTIAEVALCLYLGVDPEMPLMSTIGEVDGGVDITVNGHTIDVKASDNAFASRLMWPVKKMERMVDAADILVMAVVTPIEAETGTRSVDLRGWVTKQDFISQHFKAYKMNGIVDGTPFMNQKSLYSIEQLVQHIGHVKTTGAL